MNESEETIMIMSEAAKEVAKDAYSDVAHPAAKSLGELLSLLPRTIKVVLAPFEKWLLDKEYNLERTKKILEGKLKNVPIENIETPEPYIAVPALQSICYCMDNDELRNMYANLLANSMNKAVKNGVHPGFVEIIKQLCPDEAKFLKFMSINQRYPTINLRYTKDGGGIDILKDFTDIPKLTGCENIYDSQKYIDNLVRLGLVQRSVVYSSLTDKTKYDPLKSDEKFISLNKKELAEKEGFNECMIEEGFIDLTAFGAAFCKICIS